MNFTANYGLEGTADDGNFPVNGGLEGPAANSHADLQWARAG